MFIRLVIISTLIFFCVSFSAMGQTMTNEMTAIVRSTMAADGSINEETHRRFWELAQKEFNFDLDSANSKVQNLAKNLRELSLGMQDWQNEVWKSARMSNLEGSVVETQRLKELRANMLGNQKAAASSIWGTDAEEYMKGFETQWNSVAIPNTRRLLIAASKSDTLSSVTGEITQPITLELIDFTIASIEESLERALKLMNPIWSANFSDSKTFIIGRSDEDSLNFVSSVFFELLLSSGMPSGTVFWIDEKSGSKVVVEVRIKISDFHITVYEKRDKKDTNTQGLNSYLYAYSRKQWKIDRTSLDISSGFNFMTWGRVGQIVSEAEFNLQAEKAKTQSIMKQLDKQKQLLDQLSERKF